MKTFLKLIEINTNTSFITINLVLTIYDQHKTLIICR